MCVCVCLYEAFICYSTFLKIQNINATNTTNIPVTTFRHGKENLLRKNFILTTCYHTKILVINEFLKSSRLINISFASETIYLHYSS